MATATTNDSQNLKERSDNHGGVVSPEQTSEPDVEATNVARDAGIRIARLDEIDAIQEATRLFNRIWSTSDGQSLISFTTLRALSHSGDYLFGAYDGKEMVGASVGFIGYHRASLQLHSHITGVSDKLQGRRVGFALKQHQREWALQRGIGMITWTFDPLVRRNAFFNITKLGASVTAYYPSFYGQMNDGINAKDETDRVLVEWDLESPSVVEASSTGPIEPDLGTLPRSGAEIALAVGHDEAPVNQPTSANTLLIQVPEDIIELRDRNPALGRRWRLALRDALGSALDDGYETAGMTRSGFYVLSR